MNSANKKMRQEIHRIIEDAMRSDASVIDVMLALEEFKGKTIVEYHGWAVAPATLSKSAIVEVLAENPRVKYGESINGITVYRSPQEARAAKRAGGFTTHAVHCLIERRVR